MKLASFLSFLLGLVFHVHAIDISLVGKKDLTDKKIIYFNGSFDPFHNGHAAMVETAKNHVDYIIVFAIDGYSSRKPDRIDKKYRQAMIDGLYRNDKRVLTTSMNAYELQQYLRKLKNNKYYAMFGTDVIDQFKGAEEYDAIFHRGTDIKPEKAKDSLSAMYVVSVDQFFIFARDNRDIPDRFLNDRKLFKLNYDIPEVSSTEIKERIKNNRSISDLVPAVVEKIIKTNNLYKDSNNKASNQNQKDKKVS